MPTMTVTANNGFVDLGIVKVPVDAFTDIAVNSPNDSASGKTIKVADARVKALLPVLQHDKLANYTIAITITREPVTEQEATAIAVKSGAQAERKVAEQAKITAERDRAIALVRDAERSAADRVAERDKAVLENTIKVLTAVSK